MCVMGRLAESEEPVLFASFGEVDKCEFIKMNAPMDAWAFTDDGTGLLVKTGGLREQAREVLAREVPYALYNLPQPATGTYLTLTSAVPARAIAPIPWCSTRIP